MHFDCVDIGTSDFDTSSGQGLVLLVEPLKYYLDRIPDAAGTKKINCAISDDPGQEFMYYIPDTVIEQYSLPWWLRGCNSLGKPHPTAQIVQDELGLELMVREPVDVISFDMLVDQENITSIGLLKIDTEGHDHIILRSVFNCLSARDLEIDQIEIEYKREFENLDQLNDCINLLRHLNYQVINRSGDNVRLQHRIERTPHTLRLIAYTFNEWAFGSLHYELAKFLHPLAIDMSLLPWTPHYSEREMTELASGVDLFMTQPDAAPVLVKRFNISPEKILVVGHSIYDFHVLQKEPFYENFHLKELGIYRNIGVISESLKAQLKELEPSLDPVVLPLAINYNKFYQEPARELRTLGYAGKMHRDDEGYDCKRGHLVQRVAEQTGLELKIAEQYHNSFVTMQGFYKNVDCVLISSAEQEAGGLPAFEAAAAGRLVLSTPVGHIGERGMSSCADILPVEEDQYVQEAVNRIRYYIEHPDKFLERTTELQDNAVSNDWCMVAPRWADFIRGRT